MKKTIAFISSFCAFLANTTQPATTEVPYDLLRKLLPINAVVIEAGAHLGQDTGWMSDMFHEGTIHAFEPTPDLYRHVEKIAAEKHNIVSYQLALSDKPSTSLFYIDGGNGGANSLLKPEKYFNDRYLHSDLKHPIHVQCITLDDWAAEHNIQKIDFLWFDMEGNELNALKGATNILKTVTAIYTEVNLQTFWEGCCSYDELKSWLNHNGFEEVWKEITPHWQGNALFVRK